MASRFLSPAYEVMLSAASPGINFARGLAGYQDPIGTPAMQDRMLELEAQKGSSGSIGYEDYGLPVSASGGRFTGGLPSLLLSNPIDFGLAGSVGRYGYGPDGRTGLKYDFTPDQDTGSTGSEILDFINRGGVKNYISNLDLLGNFGFGTPAAASEVSIEEPSETSDMGYVGTSGTADDFFGSGFSATSDMGYPSVTRGGPQTFQDFYESTYESYDPEKDDEQVDYLPGQSSLKDKISGFAKNIIGQPGISSLIGFFNPLAGAVSKGLGYLGRNLNPSFVGPKGARPYGSETPFGIFARSDTLAGFLQNMRDKKARDEAAARGAAKQRAAKDKARMDAFRAFKDSKPSGSVGGGKGLGAGHDGGASAAAQSDAAAGMGGY